VLVALGVEERKVFAQQRRVAGREQILREREQRPEHDVAV
jgi:hypothetical protein